MKPTRLVRVDEPVVVRLNTLRTMKTVRNQYSLCRERRLTTDRSYRGRKTDYRRSRNEDGGVPGVEIDILLRDAPCGGVIRTHHEHDVAQDAISTSDAGPSSDDIVDAQPDTTSCLAGYGAVLERIVDTLNRVDLYCEVQARVEPRVGRAATEEGGQGVMK